MCTFGCSIFKTGTCGAPIYPLIIRFFKFMAWGLRRPLEDHQLPHLLETSESMNHPCMLVRISGGPYSLEISCCDFGGVSGSGDLVEVFTCSGGPNCVMPDTPVATAMFGTPGQVVTLTIDADVEGHVEIWGGRPVSLFVLRGVCRAGMHTLTSDCASVRVTLYQKSRSYCNITNH